MLRVRDGGSRTFHTVRTVDGHESRDDTVDGRTADGRDSHDGRRDRADGHDTADGHDDTVLRLTDVRVYYAERAIRVGTKGAVRAVEGASLTLGLRRSVGLVGESGCGKSSLGRSIIGLAPLTSGEISVGERAEAARSPSRRLSRRLSRSVQIVFQDPYSSLNPRQSVGSIVAEPMHIHRIGDSRHRSGRVERLLEQVGLPASFAKRYPHELSGGQRQRVCVARALAVEPLILICDEPTSALDVSIQAQVVDLLKDLQEQTDLTYLFITHDLALLPQLTSSVAVMYVGRLVETGAVDEVLRRPRHPYTVSLLSAAPVLGRRREQEISRIAKGDLPIDQVDRGCPFRSRCWLYRELDADAQSRCEEETPTLGGIAGSGDRRAACHHQDALDVAID